MAAYQSQAVAPVVRPAPGVAPARGLDELIPCDAYIALSAHSGRPEVLTGWMDPSVVDETDPVRADPALDLWNPDNGPPYPADFLARYRQAQRDRNERITEWAEGQLRAFEGTRTSDRVFILARTWADPRMVDPTIDPSGRPPNSCYLGDPRRANYGVWGIGIASTLRAWLSMWSLRTSQCQAAPHLAMVTVPSLVVQADADSGVFPSDAAAIAGAIAAPDKTVVTLEGDHYFLQPVGARDVVADRIAAWIGDHFAG
jgi:hypothetical protein